MRSFIVRNFALNYIIKFRNGKVISFLRIANFIFPVFLASMYLTYIDSMLKYLFYLLTLIFIFFGFIYFNFNPLTQEDLKYMSDTQKFQYNFYYRGNYSEIKKYDSFLYILINPLLMILLTYLMIF